MTNPPESTPRESTGPLALLGLAGAGLAVVLIGTVQVLAAPTVNPLRRTISEYALGPYGWMFDVGVVGLALGSALVVVALVRGGVLRGRSPATALAAAWVVGLLAVVVFEKTNWSIGPSVSGYIHRYASVVAFVSLPLAAIAVGWRHRGSAAWSRFAGWTHWLGVASLLWFGTILAGVVLSPFTSVPWWEFLPLGLVERGMALTEVAAVVVMGLWAYRAATASAPVVVRAEAVAVAG